MKQPPITRKKVDSVSSKTPGLTFGIDKNLTTELSFIKKQDDSKAKRYQSKHKLSRVKTEEGHIDDDIDSITRGGHMDKSLFAMTQKHNTLDSNRDVMRHVEYIDMGSKRGLVIRD